MTTTTPARMSLLPRWMHRLRAWAGGYFWLPCPLCRRPFGGHEWRSTAGKPASIPAPDVCHCGHEHAPNTNVGICPACTRAGRGES